MTMGRNAMMKIDKKWQRGEQEGGGMRFSFLQRFVGRKALEADWREKIDIDDDGEEGNDRDQQEMAAKEQERS